MAADGGDPLLLLFFYFVSFLCILTYASGCHAVLIQIQKVVPGTLEAITEAISEHPTISHYAADGTLQHIDTSRFVFILISDIGLQEMMTVRRPEVHAAGTCRSHPSASPFTRDSTTLSREPPMSA